MDVLMPQLGETVAEGTISAWHKQEGDRVEANEIVLDIETDKVSMEVPAPGPGTLKKILVQAGETVEVGTVLGVIAGDGEADSDEASGAEAAQAPAPQSEPAASGGGAAETPAPRSEPSAAGGRESAARPADGRGGAAAREENRRLSPAVRRLAAEHDVDLDDVPGSGRQGRITRRDMIQYLERRDSGAPAAGAGGRAQAAAQAKPAAPGARPGEKVPFNKVRKLTAEHMVRSKATSPHVLQAVEVDFAGVARVREAMRESFKARHGYSLTYLPFIAHAVCRALGDFPHANASVEDDALVLHEHVNLAIAVDLGSGEGLVAPVIRHAEKKSVAELAAAIQDLATRARSGRLTADDLAGGTYTISNSGVFGTLITAPIINQPQVAILSTDGVRKKPVVIERADGDSIAIRPVGVLAQSFDHRAIDGAYSAAFLDRIRKLIENTDWFREV